MFVISAGHITERIHQPLEPRITLKPFKMSTAKQPDTYPDRHHLDPVAHGGLYPDASHANRITNFSLVSPSSDPYYFEETCLVSLPLFPVPLTGTAMHNLAGPDSLTAAPCETLVKLSLLLVALICNAQPQGSLMHNQHADLLPNTAARAFTAPELPTLSDLGPLATAAHEQHSYHGNHHLWPGSPMSPAGHPYAAQLHVSPAEYQEGPETLAAKISRSFRKPPRAEPQVMKPPEKPHAMLTV